MDKKIELFLKIAIVLIVSFILIKYSFRSNFTSVNPVEIVVSRYNEDLSWLKNDPYNKYPVVVYNKSNNNNFLKTKNIYKVVNVKNVGRCDHTYLYHIIENYDNLADVTVFLPGSLDIANVPYKRINSTVILQEVEKHKDTVFVGNKDDVRYYWYNFTMPEYKASDKRNVAINDETKTELAGIRPYGKWFDAHFPNFNTKGSIISYGGIFSVSREDIRNHPKSYYQDLIKELSNSSNPEAGHFFERAWYAIFYPYKNIKMVYMG